MKLRSLFFAFLAMVAPMYGKPANSRVNKVEVSSEAHADDIKKENEKLKQAVAICVLLGIAIVVIAAAAITAPVAAVTSLASDKEDDDDKKKVESSQKDNTIKS